jgi:hypothetical protein
MKRRPRPARVIERQVIEDMVDRGWDWPDGAFDERVWSHDLEQAVSFEAVAP